MDKTVDPGIMTAIENHLHEQRKLDMVQMTAIKNAIVISLILYTHSEPKPGVRRHHLH